MITLKEWIDRTSGGETEARELAESLVSGANRTPALRDDPALCAAARDLLESMDRFDAELERVGYGD
jgi:hypothetical protein